MAITYDAPVSHSGFGLLSFGAKVVRSIQLSRMRSVLSQMTDAQLEEIGITSRDQIDAHVVELLDH